MYSHYDRFDRVFRRLHNMITPGPTQRGVFRTNNINVLCGTPFRDRLRGVVDGEHLSGERRVGSSIPWPYHTKRWQNMLFVTESALRSKTRTCRFGVSMCLSAVSMSNVSVVSHWHRTIIMARPDK